MHEEGLLDLQQEELPPSANTSSAPCTYLTYPVCTTLLHTATPA